MKITPPDREERRLRRQFTVMQRAVPPSRHLVRPLLAPNRWPVRVPIALTLIVGGLLSFLPILGLWMLPLGLMLLALDAPFLRPVIARNAIRLRHWIKRKRRNWRRSHS
ncbi:tryptophan synthase subunit beta [Mesobaculum littorinae]|uniref:Tryptophan synthase subunit beta n=1 Tax=Mesobaculum littorinae TaxID=2486419 RepID=A0A438ALP8_9RHOB|nr:tryptophan synthase subunit beta [Mesobaculum littorinae]RVV99564.1 tryptophan synthase subunit beta [Mesobaculum littorinae]